MDLPQITPLAVAVGLAVAVVGWLLGRLLGAGVAWLFARRGRSPSSARVFGKLVAAGVTVLSLGAAVTVVFPSVKPVDLLGGIGVISIAAGIAFQTVLGNTFANTANRLVSYGVGQGLRRFLLVVPAGFERGILRGGQGQLALYGSGAFLGRGGVVLEGLGEAAAAFAREAAVVQAGFTGAPGAVPLQVVARPLFNTREGYGSAVVPGVAQLIVQQTLLIGMLVMAGTRRERLGRLAFSRRGLLGIAAAFALIGVCSMLYYNGLVMWLQDYPRGGNPPGTLVGGALYVAAVVAFALFAGSFFRTRERPFQLMLVTALPLFFLSGLSWPAVAMPQPLAWLAKLVPSTPGINLMVKFNQMGASFAEALPELCNLAFLTLLYGALAVWRYAPGRDGA